jgi:serine/threonine protein kinase/sugar lactone lactonase YvrE
MTPERWQQIDQLFHSALERKSGERAEFLAEACHADESLRHEVESLIGAHEQSESFIEAPASDLAAELFAGSEARLTAGESVAHYQIVSLLGEGGMGEVYLAHDVRLGRQVALKRLPAQFTLDAERVHRFEQEARAASVLNHPNIVTIHEIGDSNSLHFIATEFVEGETLRQHMTTARMNIDEVLDLATQIGSALAAAHAAGIVHCDIKPENIMIRPDGFLKVLDFGLAKLVATKNKSPIGLEDLTAKQNQTRKSVILGTVNYMSPEQAKGESLDERTDVFTFGVVIYEMIAGRTPFAGDSMSETLANLINAEPLSDLAANTPAELKRIVSKMLRKKKDERYQTMKGLLADLKELKENLRTGEKLERSGSPDAHATQVSAMTSDANLQTAKLELFSSTPLVKNRRNDFSYLLAGLILVLVFAVSLNSWFKRSKNLEADAPILSTSFSAEELLTNGKVVHAVISPDGNNVIYTNGTTGKQSIWLRQLKSANNIEIIPPSDDVYGGLAFSPDGNFFYFSRRPRNVEKQLNIYRISILGGIPTTVVNEAQGWISISPDGGKLSFVRCYYREDENCSLWIANTDGSNQRKLVSRPHPFRIGDNQISPDGKTVVFAAGQSRNAENGFGLVEVNIESGAEREFTTHKFRDIETLAWLPNHSSLLIAASRIPNKSSRLWQVSAATGDASPLTGDSENYTALSLDKTASLIVARQTKADFNLLLYNRANPSQKRILADATQVRFTPNGKIIFSTLMSGNREIWSIKADGSEQRQLTNDPADDAAPVSSPDNNSIFFVSNRTRKAQVWRMNADGSNQAQVTVKEGGYPIFVSPDGRWVYYHHGLERTLWRVSTRSGEEEQLVLNKEKYRFALSPDGSRVAFSESQGEEKSIVIVLLADGQTIKTIEYADQKAQMTELVWLPDGKGLAYVLVNESDNHTLWLQPLNAERANKIADLGDDEVNSLAFSLDGKSFAVVQGRWKHDAVLIRGLR